MTNIINMNLSMVKDFFFFLVQQLLELKIQSPIFEIVIDVMCTKLCYVINPKYFKYKSYNIIINFLKEKKKKKKRLLGI